MVWRLGFGCGSAALGSFAAKLPWRRRRIPNRRITFNRPILAVGNRPSFRMRQPRWKNSGKAQQDLRNNPCANFAKGRGAGPAVPGHTGAMQEPLVGALRARRSKVRELWEALL